MGNDTDICRSEVGIPTFTKEKRTYSRTHAAEGEKRAGKFLIYNCIFQKTMQQLIRKKLNKNEMRLTHDFYS